MSSDEVRENNRAGRTPAEHRAKLEEVPDGLWIKCSGCGTMLYRKELEKDLFVCRRCAHHFRLGAHERIGLMADPESFREFDANLAPVNPLGFPGYDERLAQVQQQTGLSDAFVWGEATVGGIPVVIGSSDYRFLMASMGSVVGEKVTRAFDHARDAGAPVILFSCSGGARMHEGLLSLMQMAKTAGGAKRLAQAGLPYISVLTDPVTAGVLASYAFLGDIMIAEPNALVGFAGPRVIEQNLKIKLPPGTHTAEFQLHHGMLDLVLHRRELQPTLVKLLGWML
jgi:acetyl-CoA carboxylase carboxyl transferase subunit beta